MRSTPHPEPYVLGQPTPFYRNGEVIQHPSGQRYVRDGCWKPISAEQAQQLLDQANAQPT